jgi:hypothetical protein
MEMMWPMPNQIRSFPNGCEIANITQKIDRVWRFSSGSSGCQYWEYDQHRNWEASTLHEAKYIFKDFTAIDTHFIEELIRIKNKIQNKKKIRLYVTHNNLEF